MKYYVYILLSLKNNDIYVGSTADLQNRIRLHNQGKVKSTKPYKPWKLLESREYTSRSEAATQEMFLKNHQQKKLLKKKYGRVAKSKATVCKTVMRECDSHRGLRLAE